MRKFLYISILLSISSYLLRAQTHTISGSVLDASSLQPIKGVYVTTGQQGAQTSSSGQFSIANVPAGEVRLSTMYFSTHSSDQREFTLRGDTTITLYIEEIGLGLDEVVVTGTRTERRLSEVPVLTSVIRHHEIQRAGSTSAMETMLDNIPGIVTTPNAMGNNMRIRGLNSRYILFLVDGERMVSEGAGGNINLDQIDVNSIDHVEVINGAASALYGSNAVGAVINIITKKPRHALEAEASVAAESHNTWRYKVDVGSNTQRVTARASAFRHTSDGFRTTHMASPYADHGANLSVGLQALKTLSFKATGRYFRHETLNPPSSSAVTHSRTHKITVGLSAIHSTTDERNKLMLSVNMDKYLDQKIFERLNDSTGRENEANYISTRLVNTFRAGDRLELVGGLEHNYETVFAIKTLGPTPTNRHMNDLNAFAQAEWSVLPALELVLGARYTHNQAFGSAFSPKLSAMLELGRTKLRGSVGTAFRAPSIKELYYNFDHQGMFWIYGNPDLKAENGLYTSLSAEYTLSPFNASVAVYRNHIDNKIMQYGVLDTTSGKQNQYYTNVNSATLQGVDVNLSYTLLRQVVLKGSYSFCDARDNATRLQLENHVKHSSTASITWNGKVLNSPFSLQLAGRVTSPILYQEQVSNPDGTTTVTKEQSKPYSIWKVVLQKPFRLRKHTLELTLKCDNLFNFADASFVNPGRQYMAALRWAFK